MHTLSSFVLMFALGWEGTRPSAFAFHVPRGTVWTPRINDTTRVRRMTRTTSLGAAKAPLDAAWQHVRKALISVGGKDATPKHGNSLRQLLDHHTAVKVKVNTKPFGE